MLQNDVRLVAGVPGWVPMPAATWPVVAESVCGRWPVEMASFDLRWWFDQQGKVPARRVLAKRWRWTDGEVRTLLRHPERWWDPRKGPVPYRASAHQEGGDPPARPKLTQADPPTTQPEWMNADTSDGLTQADPAWPTEHHTRADPPSPSPSPSQVEQTDVREGLFGGGGVPPVKPKAARVPEGFEEAAAYWSEVVCRALGRSRRQTIEVQSAQGQQLCKALRSHGAEQVLAAMHFVAEGTGGRAEFLRTGYQTTLVTVLRHVAEYAELDASGSRGPPARGCSHDDYVAPEQSEAEIELAIQQLRARGVLQEASP